MLPKPLEYLGLIFPATLGMKILTAETFVLDNYLVLLIFIFVASIIIILRLRNLRYEDAR